MQFQTVQQPLRVNGAELGARIARIPEQVVEAIDVQLAVDQAVQARRPAGP